MSKNTKYYLKDNAYIIKKGLPLLRDLLSTSYFIFLQFIYPEPRI